VRVYDCEAGVENRIGQGLPPRKGKGERGGFASSLVRPSESYSIYNMGEITGKMLRRRGETIIWMS
jgi:hypothetical protein